MSRSASAIPPRASRLMTSTVSSPAMQPSTAVSSALSSAEARNCAAPGGVRSTTRLAEGSAETSSSPARRGGGDPEGAAPWGGAAGRGGGRLMGGQRPAFAALARYGVHELPRGGADLDGVQLDQVA